MSSDRLPEGYKLTEVGVIPEDWDVVNLDKIASIIDPQPDHRTPPETSGGEPYIGISDFINDTNVDRDGCRKIIPKALEKQQQSFYISSGDIIFGKIGTIGSPKFLPVTPFRYTLSANVILIKPKFEPHFLMSWLKSSLVQKQINLELHSTSQPAFGILKMRDLLIASPPLPEQRSIATALSDMDELLGGLDRLITKKRDLKQSAMQQLLTGKTRLPGFGDGKWVTKKQKEVCSYINGRAYQRTEWEASGTPVIRLQNLTGSGDEYYYSNLKLPEYQYIDYGDLIFMWSASFGPYIWSEGKAIYHYHIWKIDCDLERVNKTFYYHKLIELTENIKKGSNGSTMAHVTKGEMENFAITLPENIEEQNAIAYILSDMDTEITTLEQRRNKTRDLKQAMMQELLTGRIRLL